LNEIWKRGGVVALPLHYDDHGQDVADAAQILSVYSVCCIYECVVITFESTCLNKENQTNLNFLV
jgi:hypothetical protein